jgi:hypothetical protein
MCAPEKNHNAKALDPQGGFIFSFREGMRGFHDLLKIKRSSSLFMLGWSLVSSC